MNLLYGSPPVTVVNAPLTITTIEKIALLIKQDTGIKKATEKIRKSPDLSERKQLKRTLLPYILPFEYSTLIRNAKYFVKTDCMIFEADHVDNLDEKISAIKQDNHIALLYISVSGDGFKFLVPLSSAITNQHYLRVYNVLRLMFNKRFGIILDPSNKDLARVQYLSHDPKCYVNKKALPIQTDEIIKHLEIYDQAPTDRKTYIRFDYTDDDIKKAIAYIRKHGYLEVKDEQTWWELSMSIASLGEGGREYFLLLSEDHPLYPEDTSKALNKRYDKLLEAWGNYYEEERILNMNAFFNIIEKKYKLKSPRHRVDDKKSIEFLLADKFTNQFRNILLYDHSKAGKGRTYGWYIWDGTVFNLSRKGEISDFYLRFIEREKKLTVEAAKQKKLAVEAAKQKKDAEEHLGTPKEILAISEEDQPLSLARIAKGETRRLRDITLTWAGERDGLGVLPDELDKDIELFNVLNGVLNLRTGRLLEHSPLFKMTKLSQVIYQKNSKCPNWEEFIQKISFNNTEIANYIQEAVGYSLTGHTSEQCLFFLYGIGANGKSTFLEGLKLILGDYQVHANYETFTSFGRDGSSHSEDVVRLRGSRLVISTEINANKALNESVIKQITSGDTITARDLHSSSIEFTPTFKLWIAGNHKPKIQNFDHGIKRRIFIIPFEYRFTESEIRPQYEVLNDFKQERSGILSWALEGGRRWFKKQHLTVPQLVLDTTREYFLENNLIEQFLAEKCLARNNSVVETIQLVEEAKNLYAAYLEFTNNLNEDRLGRNQFYSRLEELGYKRSMSTSQQLIFRGLKLKEFSQEEDTESSYANTSKRRNRDLPNA